MKIAFFEILQFFITWYRFNAPCRWQYAVHYIYTFRNICIWISCGENVLFFFFFSLSAIAWTEIVEKYTLKIYEVRNWCFISFFRIRFASCAWLTLGTVKSLTLFFSFSFYRMLATYFSCISFSYFIDRLEAPLLEKEVAVKNFWVSVTLP